MMKTGFFPVFPYPHSQFEHLIFYLISKFNKTQNTQMLIETTSAELESPHNAPFGTFEHTGTCEIDDFFSRSLDIN